MFVTAKKYRQLLQERNELFDKAARYERHMNYWEGLASSNTPKELTRGEVDCLAECINCYTTGYKITVSMTKTVQFLKKLTDKGYLRRVKRGVYELTFVKNESNSV